MVAELEEEGEAAHGKTLRERLEIHRRKPECRTCHNRMDPLGFGLENYDAIGRWREKESGKPVDASGKLASGETFTGPEELKTLLVKRRDTFANHFTRKLLGYALGRKLNKFDHCVVKDTREALRKDNFRIWNVVEQIVVGYPA